MDLSERQKIVEHYAELVKEQYPQTDQYNILIFGSFLTDRYTEQSDIDIGVFSLIPGLSFRIYSFTKDYFDRLGINSDVVRMRLLESQYINVSIVTGQKYAVTDYCPRELVDYIKRMIAQYGENPQETAVRLMRQEVIA
ncbi:nucleotidyltransferase family protein [Enterocloster citroniae]